MSRLAVLASLGTLVRQGRPLRAPTYGWGAWGWEGRAAFVATAAQVLSIWCVLGGVFAWLR